MWIPITEIISKDFFIKETPTKNFSSISSRNSYEKFMCFLYIGKGKQKNLSLEGENLREFSIINLTSRRDESWDFVELASIISERFDLRNEFICFF